MYLTVVFLIILSADSSRSTLFLTRLIRTAVQQASAGGAEPLPLNQWPDDLDTASQVVFRPLFLYKHKQEEKKQNQEEKEQKRQEQLENLNIHLIDHRHNHYFYDPYYYYYYQQFYNNNNNRPEYFHQLPNANEYNASNNIRRQQRSYKT
ncbi:hypothetical protein O3M35_008305 [Rhynocoris fuscipes]|uniref:Uncharacterized protein n=1 Tax=Rhynocoris fuscipes TaxID=488301 RepID=A0AAW1D9B8_9HEMI